MSFFKYCFSNGANKVSGIQIYHKFVVYTYEWGSKQWEKESITQTWIETYKKTLIVKQIRSYVWHYYENVEHLTNFLFS